MKLFYPANLQSQLTNHSKLDDNESMIKFPVRNKKNHGFSLLELIVVIAIIGVLLAIGTVAFSTAQRKSRDARRRGDMKAWQDALEQSYAENNQSYLNASNQCNTENLNNVIPTDPKNVAPHVYTYSCTSTPVGYCLCARLEEDGSGNSAASCNYTGSPKNYFCVSNLQ